MSIRLDSSSLNVWACFLSSHSSYPFLKKEEKYSLSNKYLGDVQKWSELCSWANCYSWYSQWLTGDLGQKRGDLYSSDKFLFLRNQSHKQYSCWQDFPITPSLHKLSRDWGSSLSSIWQILTNLFQAEVTSCKYNLGYQSNELKFTWLSQDLLSTEWWRCEQAAPCDSLCNDDGRLPSQLLC